MRKVPITAAMNDLNRFQRDLLYVIAGLDEPSSSKIKGKLDEYYRNKVPNSRLYQNLNALIDKGLVEKRQRNQRTDVYELTDKGQKEIKARQGVEAESVSFEDWKKLWNRMNAAILLHLWEEDHQLKVPRAISYILVAMSTMILIIWIYVSIYWELGSPHLSPPVDVNVPLYMYLYGVLGALGAAFRAAYNSQNNSEGDLDKKSRFLPPSPYKAFLRTIAVLPLVAAVYFLAGVTSIIPGVDPPLSDRTLAAFALIIGFYIDVIFSAFDTSVKKAVEMITGSGK